MKSNFCLISQKAYLEWKNKVEELGFYSGFAYDAVIAMALALNKSEEVLVRKNKSLADFSYDDSEMAQLFNNSLSEVKFIGFSVRNLLNCN